MADLFPPSAPDGLSYGEEFVSPAGERALIAAIDAAGLAPFRFQGWLGKRQTASFGWHYDFDRATFGPATPIPDYLLPVRERAAEFARLAAEDLVQGLLIRYDPGAGIGWHRDRPVFEHVVGISLGDPAILRLRRRTPTGGFERASLPLVPRSIYHLSGEARQEWEHSIAPSDARRWSVTFRSLSTRGTARNERRSLCVSPSHQRLDRETPRRDRAKDAADQAADCPERWPTRAGGHFPIRWRAPS